MSLAPFFAFNGYKLLSLEGNPGVGRFTIFLQRSPDKPMICRVCGSTLGQGRGQHRMVVKDMPVFSCPVEIRLIRLKAHCDQCKKARSEAIDFISEESPHLTKHYAWWLGRLTEIAPVSQAAAFTDEAPQTIWRIDFERMKSMLARYKIPRVRRIGVDEVYARKKKTMGESRDDLFLTIIVDLDTRKVIWISDSRKKDALDDFFERIGPEGCRRIEVVALDQHEEYARSVRQYCPRAKIVWDRFHIVRNFLDAVNETRAKLVKELPSAKRKRLFGGLGRFIFLKRADRRSEKEQTSLHDVLQENEAFAKLELIKERMLGFFEAPDVKTAREIFAEVGRWIREADFAPLMRWHRFITRGWTTLCHYFTDRVTSAVSEGINNVIKSLKRRSFGFRNMEYFKLKIMQRCGYLNSRHYPEQIGLASRGLSSGY